MLFSPRIIFINERNPLWTPAWVGCPPLFYFSDVSLPQRACTIFSAWLFANKPSHHQDRSAGKSRPWSKVHQLSVARQPSPVFTSHRADPVSLRLETGLPPALQAVPRSSISAVKPEAALRGLSETTLKSNPDCKSVLSGVQLSEFWGRFRFN